MSNNKSLVKFTALLVLTLVMCVANLSCAIVRLSPEGELEGIDIALKLSGQLPTIDSLDATPSSISPGGSSTIQWSVSGATDVVLDQGIGSVNPTGNVTVSPTATTVYTVTATNSVGSISKSVTIAVVETPTPITPSTPIPLTPGPQPTSLPVINSFTANPTNINAGGNSLLSWNVSGATSVSITPGAASVPASGSATASPASTTTYTLTATNTAGSVTQSVTVTVAESPTPPPPISLPVILTFTAEPKSTSAGNNVNLRWNVAGASAIYIDNGVGQIPYSAGYASVRPTSTTTYNLTATNAAGTVSESVTVAVAAAPPPSIPVVSFTANPTNISSGGSSTLSWNATGISFVTIAPGGGSLPPSGTATASPISTTTYTLTATNAAGTVTKKVTVTVAAATPPPSGNAATCEQALFNAVNAVRASNGKAALTRNAYIDGLCRQHAQYMASAGTLSHDNFNARCNSIRASVPGTNPCAENVLQSNLPCDANDMAQMWYNSPMHHDNMLNAAYTISGMGIVIDSSNRIWACQIFAGP